MHRPGETLQVLTQDISMLSQTLAAMQAVQCAESAAVQSTAVIEAACSTKYSLTAVIAAMQGNAPLPNLDVIAWNHKSWTETTKQMGITKKSSNHPCPAKESGLTAQSIGVVKGKCCHIHNDPYTGGERSGKHVKPDAPSTANVAPPIKSTPGITLLGSMIPAQADMFVPPPPLCSWDHASGPHNPCASGHICASPHLCSQDHASRPHIHHAFGSSCFLCYSTPN